MITRWTEMTAAQRLSFLDLMRATVEAAMEGSIAETNDMLDAAGIPAKLAIEVRLVMDPNRDPRLER